AIKVKRYNGYVLKSHVVNIKGDYYSFYDKEIQKTELDGYIFNEDAVKEVFTENTISKATAIHSLKYNGFVHKSNVVNIKDKIYHKKDNDVICFNNKWYHISQCFINYSREELNKELAEQPLLPHVLLPKDNIPYWKISTSFSTRFGEPIPKKQAVIAYDIVYNPTIDNIEYQKVYCVDSSNLIQLITGEFIRNLTKNKKYLKKLNNKYYIKQSFRFSDEQMVTLPNTEQTFKPPNKKQLTFNFGE
ncbi:unnamed protein product, partial [marine sediment metagenome]